MKTITLGLVALLVGGGLGFALGWTPAATPTERPPTRLEQGSLSIERALPSSPACVPTPDDTIRQLATSAGCVCPTPPPADIDPSFLEPAVETWVDQLLAQCPEAQKRGLILDCEQFPCMVYLKHTKEERGPPDVGKMLCADQVAGPEVVHRGNILAGDGIFHSVTVRPKDLPGYGLQEMARSAAFSAP